MENLHASPDFWISIRPALAWGSTDVVGRLVKLLQLRPPAEVLDCGCGTGRHAVLFQELGFQTTGVDLTPTFVQEADLHAPGPRYIQADIRDYLAEIEQPRFDLITCFVTTILGYFDSADDDLAFLRSVRRVLRPGGRFVFEAANQELLRQNPLREFTSGKERLEQRCLVGTGNRLDISFTWFAAEQPVRQTNTVLRLYSGHELRMLFEQAGFATQLYANFDGQTYDEQTPSRVVIVGSV